MRFKRIIAMILSVIMTFSLVCIPGYAADVEGFLSSIVIEEGTIGGKTGVYVNWNVATGTEGIISANIAIAYDKTVFDLVNSSGEVLAFPSIDPPVLNDAQLIGSTDFEFANDLYAKEGDESTAIVAFVRATFSSAKNYSTATTIGQFFLAYKEGKSIADVTADTLRYATPEEAMLTGQSSVVGMGTGDYFEFKYGTADSTDTAGWEENLTFIYPDSGNEGGQGGNTTTSDYEIYYTLDSTTDEIGTDEVIAPNGYKEYELADADGNATTVTATFYLKNNKEETVLQAYDVYVNFDKYLIPRAVTGQYITMGTYTDRDEGDDVREAHIQFVADKTKQRTLGTTDALELGKIEFTISGDAAYGEDLPIIIQPGSKELGTNSTNIAIGGTSVGDANSYYPNVIQTVDGVTYSGVEVMTTYTVQFDANGGAFGDAWEDIPMTEVEEGSTEPSRPYQTKQHKVDLELTSAEPDRDGYTFLGWSADKDATAATYEAGDEFAVDEDTILYAVWDTDTANYTVEHLQQNVDGSAYVVVEADRQTLEGKTEAQTAAEAKSYEGFTAKAFEQKTIAADGSTVVQIYYDRNTHTLTWNDGTNVTTTNVKYGAAITVPSAPSKIGYAFGGWGQEIPSTMPDENLTFTAEWTPITYSVVYDANSGEGEMQTSTHTYDTAANLTANEFTKAGYTFNGWNTKTDGTGTAYEGGQEVMNLVSTQDTEVRLYAQWTPNTYTVKFNPGTGGEGAAYTQVFTYDVENALTPNAFTATNSTHGFAGWAETEGGPVKYKNEEAVKNLAESGEVNLYAIWKQNVIHYTANPTDVVMTLAGLPESYTIGEELKITVEPTATGYTFTSWTTTTEGVTVSDDGKTVTISATATGNVDLTANWTVNEYTITFAETGDTTIADITQDYGTDVTKPANPTKTGYTFAGWDVDGDGDTDADDEFPTTMPATDAADKTITITAIWTINQYTITFDAAGGTPTPDAITQDYNTTVDSTGVQAPSKTGYTFNGWSPAIPRVMPAEDVTITAQWREHAYSISYDRTDDDVVYDDSVVDQTDVKYSEPITLPTAEDVTKPGYELTGWATVETPGVNDTVYAPGADVSGLTSADNGSVTLYPIWTEGKYDLTFDLGAHPADEEQEPGAVEVTYGGRYPELPVVAAAPGYKFVGWYIDVDDETTKIEKDATVAITGDTELTAKYEPIKYTIKLNANGGTFNSLDTYIFTYTVEDTVNLTPAVNGLYAFKGWKLESDHGNWKAATYDSGDYDNKYGIEGQVMELVAQWDIGFTYSVESYKYAKTGYKMLRIATADNTNAYKFGEEIMYYTDNADYELDGKAVFVTLIPINDGETVLVTDDNKLTDAAMQMITQTNGAATVIARDGDVNGDEVVNIADANVVYQMVQNGGSYYGNLGNETQSDILSRLEADMHTETNGEDLRGTLDDVDVIVNDINGTN